MVRHQGDASFVSWAETLHPESATTSIDPRHQRNENPWMTVYHETVSVMTEDGLPVAVQVVSVDEDPDDSSLRQGLDSHCRDNGHNGDHRVTNPPSRRPQPWRHSNLIDLILGLAFAITSILFTFKIELAAIIIYMLAAGSNFLAEKIFYQPVSVMFKSIALLVTSIFMFVDVVLLTVSVLVTEIICWVAHLLCALSGGPRSGSEWHQFIRRACHLTRWAFRSCHKGWKPERIYPFTMDQESMALHLSEDQADLEEASRGSLDNEHQPYSDVAANSPMELTSLPESISVASLHHEVEEQPITIAPENVQVVHDDRLFGKND